MFSWFICVSLSTFHCVYGHMWKPEVKMSVSSSTAYNLSLLKDMPHYVASEMVSNLQISYFCRTSVQPSSLSHALRLAGHELHGGLSKLSIPSTGVHIHTDALAFP